MQWEESGEETFYSFSARELFKTIMDPVNFLRTNAYLDPAQADPPEGDRTFLEIYGDKIVSKGIRTYANCIYRHFFDQVATCFQNEDLLSHLKLLFPKKGNLHSTVSCVPPDDENPILEKCPPLSKKELNDFRKFTDVTAPVCFSPFFLFPSSFFPFLPFPSPSHSSLSFPSLPLLLFVFLLFFFSFLSSHSSPHSLLLPFPSSHSSLSFPSPLHPPSSFLLLLSPLLLLPFLPLLPSHTSPPSSSSPLPPTSHSFSLLLPFQLSLFLAPSCRII